MITALPVWRATVAKADLLEAIGFVRTRSGLKLSGIRLEPDVDIMSGPDGLSFRTAQLACDIPASGSWPSPVRANGAVLRRLAPKLAGEEVAIAFVDGKLILNTTQVPAREL